MDFPEIDFGAGNSYKVAPLPFNEAAVHITCDAVDLMQGRGDVRDTLLKLRTALRDSLLESYSEDQADKALKELRFSLVQGSPMFKAIIALCGLPDGKQPEALPETESAGN